MRTAVPILLGAGSSRARYEAVEIALGGVFVVTERPGPVSQLLVLRIEIPGGEPLDLHGMVAWRVEPEEARSRGTRAGMGIRFYGVRPEVQKAWESFVRARAVESERDLENRAEALAAAGGLDPSVVAAALTADESGPAIRARAVEQTAEASRPGGGAAAAPIFVIGDGPGPRRRASPTSLAAPAGPSATDEDTGANAAEEDEVGRDTIVDAELGQLLSETVHDAGPGTVPASRPEAPARPALGRPASGLARPMSGFSRLARVGHVVYRIDLPSVADLESFGRIALGSGGVMVRTADLRPPGTPAVVCVVHPVSGDELHIPGQIVSSPPTGAGVAVAFTAVTERTRELFVRFVALGAPDDPASYEQAPDGELAVLHRSTEPADDDGARDTCEIPLSALRPMREGR